MTRVTSTSSASLAKRVLVNFSKFSSFYFIFHCISDQKICLPECQRGSRTYDNISEFRNIKVNLKVKVTELELKGNDNNSSLLTCSLFCYRFNCFRLFSTIVRIFLFILMLYFKLIISRFSTPS